MYYDRRKRIVIKDKYRLFLMALPFLVLTFLFSYLPLHGWVYAFYNYRPGIPLRQNEFVGFYWFKSIVSNPTQTAEVLRVLRNTFAMSTLGLLTSVLPVIFAVFLSEIRVDWLRKSVQVLTTLPNFISWVLVYSFAFALFSTNTGFVNRILIQLGVIDRGINFLASNKHVWLTMILWSTWKSLGWNAIMYLAAITSIDPELYEAARVDGAGRFSMIWHITVPGIMPTYFVLLLLQIANFINNGMEQYYVFQNAINKDYIEVLDLYVYNIGMIGTSFSFATAVSALKSLVSVFLLMFANGLSKLVRGETII
ncbi:putative multiple-sugar transport system permease YteP [Thermoclostridium stercorarium subsp. stercorarium DSM 8532]|jgi:putative aldouronate transport system permease protein|uniref:ABC transporter permease n=3 Tax=Thermoclostridium stercorarium TaxID=1510 RepID=A0A1B1YHD8_THEST|nr:ABC transporter permease subunit [Thermoclostridium stercorarium]AGC67095.1 putative multiple-sugar transport system permease YteP [Thermoclostridium stercorarium subsp. stercorarium DSM 8532]AGI38177.1 ABC transporter periplasmic subunit-1 [Thermoclostridium stercorarium subsp. stercorarium DSM 8532]ANW97583.1 ABC transporter permease [Thermoclostridium stercorarium subsp. thermolacticum DSM 2910]ANX00142.1 ABC transporter permease [Thermoclostridium stercorarium subsp. leptospartum DSM 921